MLNKLKSFFGADGGGASWAQAFSMQGRKPSQEDAWYISPATVNGRLLLVADGVGGHAQGAWASQAAIEHFKADFEAPDAFITDGQAYLREQTLTVAARVWQKGQSDPNFKGTGTTLSGVFIWGNHCHVLQVGDSRTYHFDGEGALRQLSKDQTVVQDLLDRGEITAEAARSHPDRHLMNSAIGQPVDQIRVVISPLMNLQKGEWLLITSDGVHDAMSNEDIRSLLMDKHKPEDLAKTLVEAAYAAGSHDNITAILYQH